MTDLQKKLIENQIVALLRKGERHGVELLYDHYSSVLFGVICRIVKSEEVAKNVLQETFVKIWKNFDSYDVNRGSLFTWILNIARNQAIDMVRSKAYQISMKSRVGDEILDDHRAHSTEQNVDYIGIREIVYNLEEKYRVVIDLIYFNGYTQAEVSKELNLPLGTVKSRVRIAIRHLRNMM